MNEKKETKKEKLPSLGTMNQYAKESIKKLISLQNDDKKSLNGSRLAMQKKIMARLEKEASNGSATMGLAVMKGMVVTGINFSRFFDYTSPYKDNRGFDKIEEFAMFENIVPLMMKYKTIQKADTVMQFIRILPDLNELPFSPELYDVLNEVTEGEKSFEKTTKEVIGKIKGLAIWPTAHMTIDDVYFKVYNAKKSSFDARDAKCGEVVVADNKQGLHIKCLDGVVEITELLPINSKKMTAKSYLNGKNIRIGSIAL